jgi:hypothetical protein
MSQQNRQFGTLVNDLFAFDIRGMVNSKGNKRLQIIWDKEFKKPFPTSLVLDEKTTANLLSILREFLEWEVD